jgi:purine nucleosidase
MPQKVLLDTDIGSDIDDAVSLAYLLANPQCELLGITTVSGQPVERARLASALCRVAGKDIPVYPGHDAPLSGPQRQPVADQAAVLARWPHQRDFKVDRAVDFMADVVRSHPGEVTLLSIGPMTNIARLFQAHPDVPRSLKAYVAMGGNFDKPQPGKKAEEWNVYCDPEAGAAVYSTKVASHTSFGVDVTMQVRMSMPEVRRRFARHRLLRPVLEMAEVWFTRPQDVIFHDPLAAVALFDPEVCKYMTGTVTVETERAHAIGVTTWSPVAKGPHRVAVSVDAPRFFKSYFSVFGA